MKKISHLFFSAVGLLLLTACGSSAPFTIDYFGFQQKRDGKWGLINLKGDVLFADEFKERPSVSVNDRFSVRNKKDFYEYYETDSEPEQIGEGVGYKKAGMFTGKYAPVQKKDGRVIYIDKKGGVAIDMEKKFPGKKINEVEGFLGDWAAVRMDGKWGAMNTDGKLIVQCKYDYIAGIPMLYPDRRIFIDEEAKKWYVIDKKGKTLFSKSTESLTPYGIYEDGLIVVRSNEENYEDMEYTILDEKGNTKLKLKNKHLEGPIFDGKFVFKEDDAYGLMDVSGKVLIKAKYDRMDYNGAIIVARNDDKEWLIVDDSGKKVAELDGEPELLEPVFDGYDSFMIVEGDKECTIVDDEGKEVDLGDIELYRVRPDGNTSIYIYENDEYDYEQKE